MSYRLSDTESSIRMEVKKVVLFIDTLSVATYSEIGGFYRRPDLSALVRTTSQPSTCRRASGYCLLILL